MIIIDEVLSAISTAMELTNKKNDKEVAEKLVDIYSSMLSEEFLQKLEMGMQQFEAFEGEPGSELVLHIETESSYEHGLTLHKYKLSYSQDVLNWLKQDMGASKVWVSGKPRR